ncbi:MAG: alanine--tRNA ligase, partial [Chitinophagaceae bacterium]
PTLMFTNAGMNQFKDYFLGNKKAPNPRVADTQKCLRVSGKHNDLEEVGVDTYHHTMFEMLGNWSFGDYFKKEAIEWSWELLTKVYGLDKSRLYVTIFKGDEKEGLPKDDEAYNEWKKWLPEDRILPFGKKDNFWEMGDTGPCGPCTEIHVDCRNDEERKKVDGKTLVNKDHPQVIEIWNNVFIQFNRLKDGSLEPLPAKHVDTGMGLERLVRVIQGEQSNYDTDVFAGTIEATEKITGRSYKELLKLENSQNPPSGGRGAVAFRVIADHIRAISFTIADGQLPSNTGAGYVIRRVLRRAVRYYYSYLDYKQPLLNHLVPVLAKQFENVFPELQKQVDFVSRVVREEEDAFLKTLDNGIQLFNENLLIKIDNPEFKKSIEVLKNALEQTSEPARNALEKLKKFQANINTQFSEFAAELKGNSESFQKFFSPFAEYAKALPNSPVSESIKKLSDQMRTLSGTLAFKLQDTYGFPIDLTKLMAHENGFEVDDIEFEKSLQKQKTRSRAATTVDAEDWIVLKEGTNNFVGYDSLEAKTQVLR